MTVRVQSAVDAPIVPLPTDEALAEHVGNVHEWFTHGCDPKGLAELHERDHARMVCGVFAEHRHDNA